MELDFLTESIIKVIAGAVCGGLMGLERKTHNQVIGMRTLILICISSTLLSILSVYMARVNEISIPGRGDPTRIAAGVVSGIGFLGGGAIMKQGLNIRGLTSAAIIWTVSAFGLAIGAGLFIQVGIALAMVLLLLMLLEKLESKYFPAERTKSLHLCFENEIVDIKKLRETITSHGLIVADMNMSRIIKTRQLILHYIVKAPIEYDFSHLLSSIEKLGSLSEFSVTD
ncbi:MgtC/SapB family protein [Treponema sp.]|uniref:MgtC/SapB family protein n=1 Tax=Treponema sp. TaxID=166 RepID=UPI003EFFA484